MTPEQHRYAMDVVWGIYREDLLRDPDPECSGLIYAVAMGALTKPQARQTVLDSPEWHALHDAPPVPEPVALPALTVRQGRLWNGTAYVGARFVSEFSVFSHEANGNTPEVVRRLDRCTANGANGIRVLSMARYLFDRPRPDWAAMDRVVRLAADRGLYVVAVLFADAQELVPNHQDRVMLVGQFAQWCDQHPSVIPQLVNEPFKNGWQSATDPALLDLADQFGRLYGGAYSIGDPSDYVDDEATGEPLAGDLRTLAGHSRILVLHPERKPPDERWAGWVDHLKGLATFDVGDAYRWHDEPMGAASDWQPGRRDNRPDAHVAAMLVSAVCGLGYTYHYISEQDDATPGMAGFLVARMIDQTPDFRFRNAGTPGAAVKSFDGYGKVRTCDNGSTGWAVGYGATTGTVILGDGWQAAVEFGTPHITLWRTWR